MIRLLLALTMAIVLIAVGGTATGATSASAPIPQGQTGDQLLLCVRGLAPNGSPSTPTASGFAGSGDVLRVDAADHSADFLAAAVLFKEAPDGEAGSVTVTCTGWTKFQANVVRARTVTEWRNLESGAADGLVVSAQYNATLSGSGNFDPPEMRTGEVYVACTCLESFGYETSSHTLVGGDLTVSGSGLVDSDSPDDGGQRFHSVVSWNLITSGSSLSGSQTIRFSTTSTDINGVTVLFRLAEVIPTPKSAADTLVVGLSESLLLSSAVTVGDTLTVGLTDSVTLDQGITPKSIADALPVALFDAASMLVVSDFFTVAETLGVHIDDLAALTVTLSAADTLPVALADSASLVVLAESFTVGDTLPVALTDQATVDQGLTPKSAGDTLPVALAETLELTVTLNRIDALFVALNESVSLEATLTVADTLAIGLVDTVSLLIEIIPGQPMIRRFSALAEHVRPVEIGGEGVTIA